MKTFAFTLLTLGLLFSFGCRFSRSEAVSPTLAAAPAAVTPADALKAARTSQLAIQTVDSLQLIAGEHLEQQMLLQLSSAIVDLNQGTGKLRSLDWDLRLIYLDRAIGYNHLLSLSQKEMNKSRAVRVGELLDLSVSVAMAKLAAEQERAAWDAADSRTLFDTELELRTLTGFDSETLAELDLSRLPQPQPMALERIALQQFAALVRSESKGALLPAALPERVKQFFHYSPATELHLSESLFRLPRRFTLERLAAPERDWAGAARLMNAIGIAFEVELDLTSLEDAYQRFRIAQLKAELSPDDRDAALALIAARLAWRKAWFRLRTDLGASDFNVALPIFQRMPHPEGSDSELIVLETLMSDGQVTGK